MEVGGRVCRLCARSCGAGSIFAAGLHRRAMLLASIRISPGDGLPDRVCDNCTCQISACYDFKIQCENSDRSFRTLLSISCEDAQSENLSNLEIKQEISFETEDKNNLRDVNEEDSMDRHHSPYIIESYSVDDTFFNSIKCSNSTDNENKAAEENSPIKENVIDNKENKSAKNESYPKLRIRRESLIAKKNVDVKKNIETLSHNKIESFEVEVEFPQNGVTYFPTLCSDDDIKDEIKIAPIDTPGAFVCRLCGKEFGKEKHLQRHLQASCNSSPKKKKRNLKKKSIKFRKKRVLKLLKIHPEDNREREHFIDKSVDGDNKNFMCDVCGCIYKKLNILLQHQTTHSDIKNHSCNLCKKKFTRRSHLGAHMRIHNNIKPYVCETCGISFVKSSDLSRHKRIHSDARNYACPICPRRFKRSGDVTSHMRVHTGDRPYKCKACNKAYSSHSSLQKHRKLKCQITLKFDGAADLPGDIKPKTEVQI